MTKVEEKFTSDIFGPRVISTILWSVIISVCWLVISIVFLLTIQSPLDVFSNLGLAVQLVITPSSWFYSLLLISTCVLLGIFQSRHFTTTPNVLGSWATILSDCFRLNTLKVLGMFTLFGVIIAWCFLKLSSSRFPDLITSCQTSSYCLHDGHLMLLEMGFSTGLWLGFSYKFNSSSYVAFPIIFKDKTSQVKQLLRVLLISSVLESIKIFKYFIVFHIVFGQIITNSLSKIVFLQSDLSLADMTSYLDIGLIITSLVIASLIILINNTTLAMFNIFSCQPLELSLSDHLDCLVSDDNLMKLLSLQHLSSLSCKSTAIRQEIFSLSQPGGHPHTWNTVSKSCISKITYITNSLTNIISPPPPVNKVKPEAIPVSVNSPYIRRLAPSCSKSQVEDLVPAPPPSAHLWTIISKSMEDLKTKPILSALFKTDPDVEIRRVLSECRGVIWDIDILSHLTASSITEDKLGVVQKDLPVILSSLLDLEQVIDRCRSLLSRRTNLPDISLKLELRTAVKAGIYRIVVKFGDHLKAVPLDSGHKKKIINYQQFLET